MPALLLQSEAGGMLASRYGAQAQHSTAMHDVPSNRFASVVPTESSCSNRFAPTQSEPLGILLTRAPTRLPRCRLVTLQSRHRCHRSNRASKYRSDLIATF